MKRKYFYFGVLLLALSVLLLLPVGIAQAKYTTTLTQNVTLTVEVAAAPAAPILDKSWQEQLGGIVDVIIVDSYNNQADYLNNYRKMTWDNGIPVGQKVNGAYTNGVKLFYWGDIYADGAHALILAEGDQAVIFPADSSWLFNNLIGPTKTRARPPASASFNKVDTSGVTNMAGMFNGWSRLSGSIDLSRFNTRNVTNMSNMFNNCSSFTSLNLSGFDTRKVTDMSNMFTGCGQLRMVALGANFKWPEDATEDSYLPEPDDGFWYDGFWYDGDGNSYSLEEVVQNQSEAKTTIIYYASADEIGVWEEMAAEALDTPSILSIQSNGGTITGTQTTTSNEEG